MHPTCGLGWELSVILIENTSASRFHPVIKLSNRICLSEAVWKWNWYWISLVWNGLRSSDQQSCLHCRLHPFQKYTADLETSSMWPIFLTLVLQIRHIQENPNRHSWPRPWGAFWDCAYHILRSISSVLYGLQMHLSWLWIISKPRWS